MNIKGYNSEIITKRLKEIIKDYDDHLNEKKDPKNPSSGFFLIRDPKLGVLIHDQVNIIFPSDKWLRYYQNSFEKADRLVANLNKNHISSYQSRDEKANKFGGAILVDFNTIISFSGKPELVDEAFMLMLVMSLEWEDENFCNKIAEISNNKIFYDFKSIMM